MLWPLELLFPDPLFTILFLLSLNFALPDTQAYWKQKKAKGIHYWDSNYKLICIVNNSFSHLRLLYLEVQYIEVCERKVNFCSLDQLLKYILHSRWWIGRQFMKAPRKKKKTESLLFAFWQIPMVKHIGLGLPKSLCRCI